MLNTTTAKARCLDSHELRRWIDVLAMKILGVPGRDFIAGYRDGRFWDQPLAHSIASVLPLIDEADLADLFT